jgi:hypothetical protein
MRDSLRGLILAFWLASLSAVAAEYQWTEVTKAAAFNERDGAGAATYRGKMWLLGGWGDDPEGGPRHVGYNDVWNSTDGWTWTQIRPNTLTAAGIWEGRHCGGYVVFHDKLWVVGGDPLLKHYQNDVWSSADGVTWEQATAKAPWGQRNLHVTMVYDGKIWVMGGQMVPQFVPDVPEAFYNDVWSSTDGANWNQVTAHAPWSPRGMIQGSVEFSGRMWLLGGGTYDTPAHPTRLFYNEVWSTADGAEWRKDADAPWAPRQYHSVAVFDNKMWVMAGYNDNTPERNRNDVWYSSDGVNWSELPNTPWPTRHAGTVFVHDGHLWMVAGSHPGSTPIHDVWRLDKTGSPGAVARTSAHE